MRRAVRGLSLIHIFFFLRGKKGEIKMMNNQSKDADSKARARAEQRRKEEERRRKAEEERRRREAVSYTHLQETSKIRKFFGRKDIVFA